MTPLPIFLAVIFLGTGNCSSKIVHGNFFSVPLAASMAVKFNRNLELKRVIEIFWGEGFMVRNTVKLDNLDVRPLFVENEALLKCNFTSH